MSSAVDLTAWLGAPRMGQPVTGFIALKTPLDFEACGGEACGADEADEFTVSMFMERQASDGRSVGMVVDLTTPQPDGRRLYDTEEWTRDWDVEYVSLPCAPPLEPPRAEKPAEPTWMEHVPSE